jgi:hypothetical protein
VAGTWQALAVYGSAALELGGRWVRVERNGRSASDSDVPFRLRLSASFPAAGSVGAFAGALLRIPPSGGGETDAQHLRGPALETELLAGLQVRL